MADRPTDGKTPVEQMKRILLIGLGATVYSAEKIRELTTEIVNEMVAQGEMTQKEAIKFGEELTTRASHKVAQEHRRMEKLMKDVAETSTKKMLDAMGLVTRAEFDALKRDIERLSRGEGGEARREAPRRSESPRRAGTSDRRGSSYGGRSSESRSGESRSGERRYEDRRGDERRSSSDFGDKKPYGDKKKSYGEGPKRGFGAKPLASKGASASSGKPPSKSSASKPGAKPTGKGPGKPSTGKSGFGRSTGKPAPKKKK